MGRPLGTVDEIIADVLGEDIGSALKLPRAFLEEVARDILLSLQSDGLVVVPLKATDEMIRASDDCPTLGMKEAWQAMVRASPHRLGSDEYWDNLLKMHSDEPEEAAQ